jgi:GrpB-like predicted nucleotidyltransferase (UPF0157 family)
VRPIRVVDYGPIWPDLFDAAKRELLALATDRILAVEHIGSTSVPGLAAKPKIDLDAVLAGPDAVGAVGALVQTAGFVSHGDHHGEGRWTFTRDHDGYGLRLYLCAPNNSAHRDRILFRDYLRLHPQRAAEYQSLKQSLAAAADGNWDFYTGGKSDFISQTLQLAAGVDPTSARG